MNQPEKESDPAKRQKYLNFVIIGGGPTGVELAGAISEIVNKNVIPDFRNIDASMIKVYLIEALSKILSTYPDKLSAHALDDLKKLQVDVILGEKVTEINENGVRVGDKFIESSNVLWAAGNQPSPLIKSLGTETNRIRQSNCK